MEARWNHREDWFRLQTLSIENGELFFGDKVLLSWQAPGEHYLHFRAFDGMLFGPEINVTVVVRDLADLVITENDITIEPTEPKAGKDTYVVVIVHNQGGEDASTVVVTIDADYVEVGRMMVGDIPAGGSAKARIKLDLEPGTAALLVSVSGPPYLYEWPKTNNEIEMTITVEEDRGLGTYGWITTLVVGLGMGILIMVVLLKLRRKDSDPHHAQFKGDDIG